MRTWMLIFMFFCLGAFFIVSNDNIHLNRANELSHFGSLYMQWLGHLFDNAKYISGYVIKFEWLPQTNSSH